MDYSNLLIILIAVGIFAYTGMDIATIIGLVLLYALFAYFLIPTVQAGDAPQQQVTALSLGKNVATVDDGVQFLSGNAQTFQAFVYMMPLQRTGETTVCNNKPGGDPNCTTDRYDLCECDKNDCSSCNHKAYFNLLNISNVVRVEVLAAPDAGRPNHANAQLVVRTIGIKRETGQQRVTQETIALPPIPFQKWVLLTISREGRRFDIYYNDALVLSKRVQSSLDVSSSGGSIVAGDSRLFGQLIGATRTEGRMSSQDVAKLYRQKTDTNGEPYTPTDMSALKKMNPCPNGDCLKSVTVRPASPLYNWDTQYD
jgi:hypothetical protein